MRTHIPETGWVPVVANGVTHAVFDEGEGPLVLLIHGFPDTAHTWDEVAPALVAEGFRVVRPFGRGIAPSEIPSGNAFHVRDLAADVVALIEALGEETAIVVGHDWGAAAVWGAGHIAPERISKLVVVGIPYPPAVRPTLSKLWGARHFLANKLPWATRRFRKNDFAEVRRMYERWSPGFAWPDSEFESAKNAYAHPGCASAAIGYYRRLGLWPFKGKVSCNVFVIGGQSDGVVSAADFERSARFVDGNCRVEMLPGGHFLHREHPQPFIDTLLDCLRD